KYNWQEANKQYLVTAISALKEEMLFFKKNQDLHKQFKLSSDLQSKLENLEQEMQNPPALAQLADLFRLTSFEQKIVLMCAASELDSDFVALFSDNGDIQKRTTPSFGLALSVFKDAHWSALSPESVLRYWKLIEVTEPSSITKSPLVINEQILHYLTGIQHLDGALEGMVEP
ncbi:MAG: hypothetical protein KDC05_17615, partial [Bacteroidales bacterium]|nr:hypothetical protein [Bacteroidales bacterium]